MARYSQDDMEQRQAEQGERFLKQLADMFTATRQDLATQFVPRPEAEARFDHLEQVVERIGTALERLTSSETSWHESVPRIYADRAETKQDVAELRTEIEKLKTAREADMQRGYSGQMRELQGRFQGDATSTEQVLRGQIDLLQGRLNQMMWGVGLVISGVIAFIAGHALFH